MAADQGLAILGTSRAAMANSAASDQAILDALSTAAELSGRAELRGAPYMVYGISGGAPEASGFVARNPKRTAALFLKVPVSFESVTGTPVPSVPTYVVLAQFDAFVDNNAIKAAFARNRASGAQWALALEMGVPHHSFSPAHRTLTLNWMNTILSKRLGPVAGDSLRTVNEDTGWVGDPVTTSVMAFSSFTGNPRLANWLPSQATAEEWRTFVRTGMP